MPGHTALKKVAKLCGNETSVVQSEVQKIKDYWISLV
jgi:hypothetical protein